MMKIENVTSEIANLPAVKLKFNSYSFTLEDGVSISSDTLCNAEVYVIFKGEMYLVKPFNKVYKVSLPFINSYTVDQIYINDPELTLGEDVHLKMFLDKFYCADPTGNKVSIMDSQHLVIGADLLAEFDSKVSFPKVLIDIKDC